MSRLILIYTNDFIYLSGGWCLPIILSCCSRRLVMVRGWDTKSTDRKRKLFKNITLTLWDVISKENIIKL